MKAFITSATIILVISIISFVLGYLTKKFNLIGKIIEKIKK